MNLNLLATNLNHWTASPTRPMGLRINQKLLAVCGVNMPPMLHSMTNRRR